VGKGTGLLLLIGATSLNAVRSHQDPLHLQAAGGA
jgi:hypothetical protein